MTQLSPSGYLVNIIKVDIRNLLFFDCLTVSGSSLPNILHHVDVTLLYVSSNILRRISLKW